MMIRVYGENPNIVKIPEDISRLLDHEAVVNAGRSPTEDRLDPSDFTLMDFEPSPAYRATHSGYLATHND